MHFNARIALINEFHQINKRPCPKSKSISRIFSFSSPCAYTFIVVARVWTWVFMKGYEWIFGTYSCSNASFLAALNLGAIHQSCCLPVFPKRERTISHSESNLALMAQTWLSLRPPFFMNLSVSRPLALHMRCVRCMRVRVL